jgi:hypothetical protein
MDECIEVVVSALVVFDGGAMSQPLRSVFVPRARRMKVSCVISDNPSRGLDGHQGQVLLADGCGVR